MTATSGEAFDSPCFYGRHGDIWFFITIWLKQGYFGCEGYDFGQGMMENDSLTGEALLAWHRWRKCASSTLDARNTCPCD